MSSANLRPSGEGLVESQGKSLRTENGRLMTSERKEPGHSAPRLSSKHAEARDALDERLHPVFDALVQDYQFYASIHYASRFVSYLILADLVRAGWRLVAPSESREQERETTMKDAEA